MQTRSHWKSKRWRSVAQCFIGSIALALVTLVCFRLEVDLPTTAFVSTSVMSVKIGDTVSLRLTPRITGLRASSPAPGWQEPSTRATE
jgi:hypothetical protein